MPSRRLGPGWSAQVVHCDGVQGTHCLLQYSDPHRVQNPSARPAITSSAMAVSWASVMVSRASPDLLVVVHADTRAGVRPRSASP